MEFELDELELEEDELDRFFGGCWIFGVIPLAKRGAIPTKGRFNLSSPSSLFMSVNSVIDEEDEDEDEDELSTFAFGSTGGTGDFTDGSLISISALLEGPSDELLLEE